MKLRSLTLTFVSAGALGVGAGCSDTAKTPTAAAATPGDKNADDDERGSVGVPPPAAAYCKALGYELTLDTDMCVFPDGTSCEMWSFFWGKCGQAHSYCSQHGGQISSWENDAGSFTTVAAVCTLNGKTCDENDFYKTGKCE